jgi:hypothetical protein
MAYGEIFWREGLGVYALDDENLRDTYNVPEDHLLPPGFELKYEYPFLCLIFYAILAVVEPGEYNTSHCLVNWILVIVVHLNLILFLYLSHRHWYKTWLTQVFAAYYVLSIGLSVFYAKEEPLADFLLLSALIFFNKGQHWHANVGLALAFNVKIYPVLVYPFFLIANPVASISFIAIIVSTMIPMLFTGFQYSPLLAHLINSSEYVHFITNPLFVGWTLSNPLAIIAPLIVILTSAFCIIKLKHLYFSNEQNINSKLRVLVFLYPIILIFYSFIQLWYYVWFIPMILLLQHPEEMKQYRWLILSIWIAHFLGIILNFSNLWEWTILQFFAHINI